MTDPSKPLTSAELADLKAKAKAATPGEWEAVTRDDPRGQPVPYHQSLICTVEHSPDKHLSIVAKNGHRISREEREDRTTPQPHDPLHVGVVGSDVCISAKGQRERACTRRDRVPCQKNPIGVTRPMTNPTADAAKLLPRVFQVEVENHSDGATVTMRGINLCDTRPQPAPPAGEPDFAMTAKRLLPGDYLTKIIGDDEIRMFQACAYQASIEHELRKAYRLGLASRPKVEDAEVKDAVKWLREFAKNWADGVAGAVQQDHPAWDRADLLERLASERDEYIDHIKATAESISEARAHVEKSEVRREQYLQRAEAAEAKLAEIEAELAAAQAVLAEEWEDDVAALQEHPDHFARVIGKAIADHAARQQQKASAEPTERDGDG